MRAVREGPSSRVQEGPVRLLVPDWRNAMTKRRARGFLLVHLVFMASMISTMSAIVAGWETAGWWLRLPMWLSALACYTTWRYVLRDPKSPPTKLELMVIGDGPYTSATVCASCGRPPPATSGSGIPAPPPGERVEM